MRLQTLASKFVLVGTCSLAAAGWFGVRVGTDTGIPTISAAGISRAAVTPDAQAGGVQTGVPGVRDRSAWQPSPIPSGVTTVTNATNTDNTANTANTTTTSPTVRDRSAWQPSPVPSKSTTTQAQPLPSINQAPPMGGAALATGVGAALGPQLASALQPSTASTATDSELTGELPYTPLSQMFTTDRLEALFAGELPAQRGEWVEQHFYSKALGRDDAYMVWLPPDYNATSQRYPTLYLLHGVGGPSGYGVEEWMGYALTEDLDRMLALGVIQPMIVVLPNGEQGYWMNHSPDTDGTKWADYVAVDLVKDVDAHFRTDPRREKRAIGGLSMGGHGALQIALNHPDEFAVAGAHSPTIRPFETSPEFFGDQKWFAKYDPISLAKNTDAASKLAIWLDVGYEDPWRPITAELAQVLQSKKTPAQFHVLEGEHEGWYWDYYLPEYLHFYSSALDATAKTAKGAPVVSTYPLATIASALQPTTPLAS